MFLKKIGIDLGTTTTLVYLPNKGIIINEPSVVAYSLLDKKVLGSRRIGGDSSVQYKYSETEKTYKFTVYKWDESTNNWVVMSMDRGEMIF